MDRRHWLFAFACFHTLSVATGFVTCAPNLLKSGVPTASKIAKTDLYCGLLLRVSRNHALMCQKLSDDDLSAEESSMPKHSGVQDSYANQEPAQDLASAAARALREAEDAARRAQDLRSAISASRPSIQDFARTAPSVDVVREDGQAAIQSDPGVLASEMGAILNSLQRKRGQEDPLADTKWILELDFGREFGTWMPPAWGASGTRVRRSLCVHFLPGGDLAILPAARSLLPALRPASAATPAAAQGRWSVHGQFPGEEVKFEVVQDGFSRADTASDLELPPGRLYFAIKCLGRNLSTRPGGLSIEQTRMFVRRERRIVGTFRARPLTG